MENDHLLRRYDYLVVETSGVSDPNSMIQALDKTFGKLTRARLDSVVAVVDSDFLLGQLDAGQGLPVALRRQLEQADVVLLNKADLLDPQRRVLCHMTKPWVLYCNIPMLIVFLLQYSISSVRFAVLKCCLLLL